MKWTEGPWGTVVIGVSITLVALLLLYVLVHALKVEAVF